MYVNTWLCVEQLDELRAQHQLELQEQTSSHQEQLEQLQLQLEESQNESLQLLEENMAAMDELQAKLAQSEQQVQALQANGAASQASDLELAEVTAAMEEEHAAETEKLKATHTAQVAKMTKERQVLIREVKKLQMVAKQAQQATGGADAAEIQKLKQDLADKDALLAQQAEEIEALITMQAEGETSVDAKVEEALAKAKEEHAKDIATRGQEMQASLQRQADGFNVERAGFENQMEQLRSEHAAEKESMQRQLDALQEKGPSQAKHAQQAIAAESAMQEVMMDFDARLRDMQTKLDTRSKELEVANAEAESLRAQLEDANNTAASAQEKSESELQTAKQQIEQLEVQVQTFEDSAAVAQKEHEDALAALRQEKAEIEAKAAQTSEEKSNLDAEVVSLKLQVDTLEKSVTSASEGQASVAAEAQLKIDRLEREVANLNKQLNVAEEQLDASQQTLTDVKAQQKEREDEAIAREMELKSQLADAEAKATANAGAESRLIEREVELKAQIDELEAARQSATDKLAASEANLAAAKEAHSADIAKLEAAKAAAASAGGEMEEMQEEAIYQAIQGLQEEHDVATKEREEQFAAQLEAAKAEKEEAVAAAKAEQAETAAQLQDVREKLESASAAAQAARDEHAAAKAELEALAQELGESQTSFADTLAASETQVQGLESEVASLKLQISEAGSADAGAAQLEEAESRIEAESAAAKEWQAKHDEAASRFALEKEQLEASAAEAKAAVEKELAEAKAQAEAAEAALVEVSSGDSAAGGLTQADIDAAVAKELAAQEEAHKRELMNVRIQAAKRLAASPRAGAKTPADPVDSKASEEAEALRKEVQSLKDEAANVAGVRQREKMVLVQEIRRNRGTLEEKEAKIKELEAAVESADAKLKVAESQSAASDTTASPAVVADLEAKLESANARAASAQNTIDLQFAEIKRLKDRIAELESQLKSKSEEFEAMLEEMADAAATPTASPRHTSGQNDDDDIAPKVSPAMRRVKQVATPQSVSSLDSQTSFDSRFDTDDDDSSYGDSPQKGSQANGQYADGEGGYSDLDDHADERVEDDDDLSLLEDEMVDWLHDNGFGEWEEGILSLGVEMMDDLKLLSPEDLQDIKMSPAVVEEFMLSVGSRFKVGQLVKIINLTKAQMFNGMSGYIVDPIKDGRYTIKLHQPPAGSTQTLVSCYPTNLVASSDAPQGSSQAPAPADTKMVSRGEGQSPSQRAPPANADQKSRLISESVSPSDTLSMVRNPGTWSRTTTDPSQRVTLSHTEWTEVDCGDHPPPRCSLESPLIQQILQSWTRSSERLEKMNAWLRAIMRGAFNDPDFSWGIEIAELTPEVANGFLTVLLPLVVIRAPMLVNVYVRLSHAPGERRHQPTIDLRLSLNGWQQVDCTMNPAPKCDILSPLIQNLLECWTSNRERLRRMNDWLQTVMVGRFDDENFMDGIEMLELAPEIVQGFLTMLVPLIQVRSSCSAPTLICASFDFCVPRVLLGPSTREG